MSAAPTRIALTCDDAPSIDALPGHPPEPARMDRLRDTFRAAGVAHCVAFVIGRAARGAEDVLERWLDAGYELGNHTDDHHASSARDVDATLRSIEACDALLRDVGAFDAGRTRWLRFPYLDRGADAAARARLQRGIEDLGYRIAPASTDLFDHRFEEPLAAALAAGDTTRVAAIEHRYLAVVRASVRRATARTHGAAARDVAQVAYLHFGLVWDRFGASALRALHAEGARWCPLDEALGDALYADHVADATRNGLVVDTLPRPLVARILGRAAQWADRAGLTGRALGPRWPHVG